MGRQARIKQIVPPIFPCRDIKKDMSKSKKKIDGKLPFFFLGSPFNSLAEDDILDWSKLKAFALDKLKMTEN